jgi:DNA-directed RNA polymerase alpha subunit
MADRVSKLLVLVERGVVALERLAAAAEGAPVEPTPPLTWEQGWDPPPPLPDRPDKLIEELELAVRPYNCLKRAGVAMASQISQMEVEDFYRIPNLGKFTLRAIRDVMEDAGFPHRIPLEAVLTSEERNA